MHINKIDFGLFILMMSFSPVNAVTLAVDQSQTAFDRTGDLSSSGLSGQTFQAGIDGQLQGIRLFVEPRGFSTSPILGSDFTLSLRSVTGGTPTNNILATGNFIRTSFTSSNTQQIDILFNSPYQQSSGEFLAFTILETSGGGRDGFNEYGNIDGNRYTLGQQFFTFSEGSALSASDSDFAFETLVSVPEPSATMMIVITGCIISVRRTRRRS